MKKLDIDPRTRILVGVPTMGGINAELVSRLILWAKNFPRGVVNFYFTHKVSPVDRARNKIVDYFLSHADLTHLFFVDSDTVPPTDALEKLLMMETDIATGLTPMVYLDKEKNVWGTFYNAFIPITDAEGKFIRTENPPLDGKVHEVRKCGGSCLMIRREVFDKLERPYFRFILDDTGIEHTKSEDIYFCDTAREKGFKVMAHTGIICNHHKEVML